MRSDSPSSSAPDHGPFVYLADEDADWSRKACPEIVGDECKICGYGPETTGPVPDARILLVEELCGERIVIDGGKTVLMAKDEVGS